jgi:hypothetical protein
MLQSLSLLARTTAYRPIEFVIVGRRADTVRAHAALDRSDADPCCSSRMRAITRILDYDGPPDAALAAMAGASNARGELLLFLGEPLEPLDDDWLTAMLEYAQQPDIGAVGAKIYRRDGHVWHAGVIVPGAVPHLVGRNDLVTRNYAAVSGACLLTSRRAFEAIGGFRSTESAGCSDIDYCLRLRDRGNRIVFTPLARLQCTADAPPALPAAKHITTFHQQWAQRITVDPYYNRNFRQDGPWFVVGL